MNTTNDHEKLDPDEPSAQQYKRKLATRESALIEVRDFVAKLKLGVTTQKRDSMLALLDRALDS